ncbi:MAG: 4'-phosphopantetheinyl transferase superfamily protein [Anaerolineae bacterium]|nr:4'-phosphopantetheinyl transferase superfamily protein [Anaerolineae bacterium]
MVHFHQEWQRPPAVLSLEANEIHCWVAPLDQPPTILETLAQCLSADERERAAGFYFERHRAQYVAARGILRHLLAYYTRQKPVELRFSYAENGKPALRGNDEVRFNLSHSGDLVLYAFAHCREVGVDLEEVRPLSDLDSLAERSFSPIEVAALHTLPPHQRLSSFFACWARKEAFIKALGNGLSYPLDQFDVSFLPGETTRLLRVLGDPAAPARWQMDALDPAEGYAAALVSDGQGGSLRRWVWDKALIVTG